MHELVYWPIDHECAPSATSHLARIFTDRCYAAVEADPTKSVFQIWKDVRTDMGQHLTSENRESFLSEIPKLHSIKSQLYKHHIIWSKHYSGVKLESQGCYMKLT